MLRLAADLPKGDPTRREILAALSKEALNAEFDLLVFTVSPGKVELKALSTLGSWYRPEKINWFEFQRQSSGRAEDLIKQIKTFQTFVDRTTNLQPSPGSLWVNFVKAGRFEIEWTWGVNRRLTTGIGPKLEAAAQQFFSSQTGIVVE
jgi:hypothetical protein